MGRTISVAVIVHVVLACAVACQNARVTLSSSELVGVYTGTREGSGDTLKLEPDGRYIHTSRVGKSVGTWEGAWEVVPPEQSLNQTTEVVLKNFCVSWGSGFPVDCTERRQVDSRWSLPVEQRKGSLYLGVLPDGGLYFTRKNVRPN